LNPEDASSTNENLAKQGDHMDDLVADAHRKVAYGSTLAFLCRTAGSDADLMDKVALLNQEYGVHIPVPLYRAALRLGSPGVYPSAEQFMRACQAALGRKPSQAEVLVVRKLGNFISRRGQARRADQASPWQSPQRR
jgi:hypothetical protein